MLGVADDQLVGEYDETLVALDSRSEVHRLAREEQDLDLGAHQGVSDLVVVLMDKDDSTPQPLHLVPTLVVHPGRPPDSCSGRVAG